MSSGYLLVLSWLSSAGGSGKHPFSHDCGASLLWDWLSQCEWGHHVPVSWGWACHMHVSELHPDTLNGNLRGGWDEIFSLNTGATGIGDPTFSTGLLGSMAGLALSLLPGADWWVGVTTG